MRPYSRIQKYQSIPVSIGFSHEDFEQIKSGFSPTKQEDKWEIWWVEKELLLYLARPLSGEIFFELKFMKCKNEYVCTDFRVTKDEEVYFSTEPSSDVTLVEFIIDVFLLKKFRPFPIALDNRDDVIMPGSRDLHQYRFTGTGFPVVNAWYYELYKDKPMGFWKQTLDYMENNKGFLKNGELVKYTNT